MPDCAIEQRVDFIGIGGTERRALTALQPMIAAEVGVAFNGAYLVAVQNTSPVRHVEA